MVLRQGATQSSHHIGNPTPTLKRIIAELPWEWIISAPLIICSSLHPVRGRAHQRRQVKFHLSALMYPQVHLSALMCPPWQVAERSRYNPLSLTMGFVQEIWYFPLLTFYGSPYWHIKRCICQEPPTDKAVKIRYEWNSYWCLRMAQGYYIWKVISTPRKV